jgi:hypothetical protein
MSRREHPGWRAPLHAIRLTVAAAVSAAKFREPSYTITDALQFYPPAVQLDALFITAVSMAVVIGKDPHEMVERAKRIIPEADGPFTVHIAALREYAKEELR